MTKLNQVLAIEKGVKARTTSAITKLYHQVQKSELLGGLAKTYQPIDEDGQQYPPERKKVQVRAEDVLKDTSRVLSELFNTVAQKDWANCDAKASVVVDGKELVKDAPVTYLLFLEKQLTDLRTITSKIPSLDGSEDWNYDSATGMYKTSPVQTTRTEKVKRAIVLYAATPEHPAQTQLISEDIVAGYWTTTKQSGALTADRKVELLERIEKLLEAVKFAREAGNNSDAPRVTIADAIFGYLLK
ncbi:MAG: hypothetical protein JRL30_29685 [Deltaproteobacteria bacterium]|nr:hypothetical protein [Deltaproteobacteria bacterium]